MTCARCGGTLPEGNIGCPRCDASPKTRTGASPPIGSVEGWTATVQQSDAVRAASSLASLQPGSVLAERYEIEKMLGQGGMGAVYKARDRELDRPVAIKVIRPELAEQGDTLRRFKQELILARQVTHRNVIRIFDLGQHDTLRFITMEFVEGQDLRSRVQERGKFTPEEAVDLILQTARALEAAHAEGVVHRDLKPQNIMIDPQERAVVMDFGIARSMDAPGMTQTGVMLGTPDYMSPEQARGEKADTRSDLFTLGLIFYELLTGVRPFHAETMMGMLLKRVQEAARPAIEIAPALPVEINGILMKCLERDRDTRYQAAADVVRDLEEWRYPQADPPPPPSPVSRRIVAAAAGAAAALALSVYLLRDQIGLGGPKPPPVTVTVLVADFDNQTGDPVFDSTLESVLTLAIEGAPFLTAYDARAARQAASQIRKQDGRLDQAVARLVATREGISVVLAGTIARQGGGYSVTVKAVDAVTGKEIANRDIDSANKNGVLGAVSQAAARIRRDLGDATPESAQLAKAETFSAATLEAAHSYGSGQQRMSAGKWEEAIAEFQRTVRLDANLGRAYAGMATAYRNIGKLEEAERFYQMAFQRIDRMTEREKHRTRGGYYAVIGNPGKALEEYSALVKAYPSDSAGRANLAATYLLSRNMPKALEEGRLATKIYPKHVAKRNNVALYAMYAGDFAAAEKEALETLKLDPAFEKAFVALALAELGQGQPQKAAETYQRLERLSARGASVAGMGLADLAMYEGRLNDAAALLEKGIAADETSDNAPAAAVKLVALASIQADTRKTAAAVASADKALKLSSRPNIAFPAARIYLRTGQEAKARAVAAELARQLTPDTQAYARLIEAGIASEKRNWQETVRLIQEAQKHADTWIGRFDLGVAYVDAGDYVSAHSELEHCLRRRGEATAWFLDEAPSYRLLPPVYLSLARAQAGLRSDGGMDSLKTLLSIKKGAEDPVAVEARRLLEER